MELLTPAFISTRLNLGPDVEIIGYCEEVSNGGHSRLVIDAAPKSEVINKCPYCGSVGKYYDTPRSKEGPKEWVALPIGHREVVIRFKTQRINCPQCGIVIAAVPWAFPNSGFTKDYDLKVTWLSLHMSKYAVAEEMGIAWATVGKAMNRVIENISSDLSGCLDDLVEIGIGENSYGRGNNKFITVVYNHRNQKIVWAKKGHSAEIIDSFFKQFTDEQRNQIKFVSVHGSEWIYEVVKANCPNAKIGIDTYHVFQWLSEAADAVRKIIHNEKLEEFKALKDSKSDKIKESVESYNQAFSKLEDEVATLKKARQLLRADPQNLSAENFRLREKFLAIDPELGQISERIQAFRKMMALGDLDEVNCEFDKFVNWANSFRFKPFNKVADMLVKVKTQILDTVQYKLTNGMV